MQRAAAMVDRIFKAPNPQITVRTTNATCLWSTQDGKGDWSVPPALIALADGDRMVAKCPLLASGHQHVRRTCLL
jgi:hypothetical protein